MGTYPHGADSPSERSARPDAADPEPHVPHPLPQQERRTARTAILVMVAALVIIALVVLL